MNTSILALIILYSNLYNINPVLVAAVVQTESGWDINATSKKGAVGLMQLLPSSFPQYKVTDLYDPVINIREGVKYLAKMQKECVHKDELNFLVCFNLGPNSAKKVKHPELFPYVIKVKKIMNSLARNN